METYHHAYHHDRMTIELHNDEIGTMRELVRLAHERLVNAPRIQMKGCPLERQAGLVGHDLFRAKQMLEKLGKELGLDCSADAAPDNEEAESTHIVSGVISANSPEEAAEALSKFISDILKTAGARA